jgi:hypothetical protein
MASTQVKYDTRTTGGQTLWGIVSQTLQTQATLSRIKNEMDAIVGSPADYTQLEVPFGLVAGTGQTFYNLVAGVLANLNTTCVTLPQLDKLA